MWTKNYDMILRKTSNMRDFNQKLDKRIVEVEEIEGDRLDITHEMQGSKKKQDEEMLIDTKGSQESEDTQEKKKKEDEELIKNLDDYWFDYINGVNVEISKDNDKELLKVHKIWQSMPEL